MKTLLITLLITLISLFTLGQNKSVNIQFHHGAYYDVFVQQEGKKINLTRFKSWERIKDLKVSPDKKYFFFRHKADKGGAFRMTMYDFKSLKKIAEIVPGFGGDFEWNSQNQILHSWGCGTNCSNLRVYNSKLKEIFYTLSTGGFEYSPQKNVIVQMSMNLKKFWVFDLGNLNNGSVKGFQDTLGFTSQGERFYLWSLKFADDYTFQIYPPENSTSTEVLKYDLNQLKWTTIKPEEIGEFYKRVF